MNKEYLAYHYTELNKTTRTISEESGISRGVVLRKLKEFGIEPHAKGPMRKRVYARCAYCSKEIERRPSTLSAKNFCNYDCYHKWMVGNTCGENSVNWKGGITAISSNNLKTPEFRMLKKVVLRLFPVCVMCGEDSNLHVHHIKTRREYPELSFTLSNLITLCRSCHSHIKGKEHDYEEYFTRLICKGGELLGSLNADAHGYQQPSQSNVIDIVGWKVQRLTGEDSQTDKPDTSAAPERDDIVRTYVKA